MCTIQSWRGYFCFLWLWLWSPLSSSFSPLSFPLSPLPYGYGYGYGYGPIGLSTNFERLNFTKEDEFERIWDLYGIQVKVKSSTK